MLSRNGKFKGWTEEQISNLYDRALKIVRETELFAAVSFMYTADFEVLYRDSKKPKIFPMSSKFGLCVWAIIDRVVPILNQVSEDDLKLNFVADRGQWAGAVERIVEWLKKNGDPIYANILGTSALGSKDDFPGLQVADVVATLTYHGEKRPPVLSPYEDAEFKTPSDLWGKILRIPVTGSSLIEHRERHLKMIEARHAFWTRNGSP
jgi:hypothetical protein